MVQTPSYEELQHQADQMDSRHLVADFLCSVVQNPEQGLLCEHKVCLMVIAAYLIKNTQCVRNSEYLP